MINRSHIITSGILLFQTVGVGLTQDAKSVERRMPEVQDARLSAGFAEAESAYIKAILCEIEDSIWLCSKNANLRLMDSYRFSLSVKKIHSTTLDLQEKTRILSYDFNLMRAIANIQDDSEAAYVIDRLLGPAWSQADQFVQAASGLTAIPVSAVRPPERFLFPVDPSGLPEGQARSEYEEELNEAIRIRRDRERISQDASAGAVAKRNVKKFTERLVAQMGREQASSIRPLIEDEDLETILYACLEDDEDR